MQEQKPEQEEYLNIRRQAEADGMSMDDKLYYKLFDYAKRKAKVAGKDESYIQYLLPDVIKEYFLRNAVNSISTAMMGFERYIQNNTKTEVSENGRTDYGKAMAI